MEMNISKEILNTKRELLNKNYEQPMEISMVLPEYYPEIEKILSCKAEPYIASKSIEGNSLVLNGTVNVTLIYDDAEGNMNAYHASMPYTKKIELNLAEMSFSTAADAIIAYLNYKATSPKKVDVRGALNIHVEISAIERCEVIQNIANETVEAQEAVAQGNRFFGSAEQNVFIEEELAVENDKAPVKCILKVIKNCRVDACKVISNKAIVKGMIECSIVYCSVNNQIERLKIEIPFNQVIDFDGLNDNCNCIGDAQICSFDVATKTNYDGEIRTLVITATICLKLEAYENSEIHYLSDAYATRFETKIDRKEISISKLAGVNEEKFVCKKKIELPEEIMQIEACWGEATNITVRQEDKEAVIGGNVLICVILRDMNNQCKFVERMIDFEWTKAMEDSEKHQMLQCDVKLTDMACNISGEGIEIQAELKTKCNVLKKQVLQCIESMEIMEDKPIKNIESIGAVLYFAKTGDDLWDIAKEHNTSKELIKEYNELDSDIINENMALLLPIA